MLYDVADHKLFATDAGTILLTVEQGGLFIIDEQTRQLISGWPGGTPLDSATLTETELEIVEGLRDIRILAVAGEPHKRVPRVVDPADIPLVTMVLEVSQECNLRCSYCYAEGGSYGKAARLLDPALARTAVRSLVEQSPDHEKLTLVLFGGEPLLNMDAVRAAVEELEQLTVGSNKQVFVSLTTNGTLMTPKIAAYLRQHRIALSVSMDGPADLHDANRADAQGVGSYSRIVSCLSGLCAAGGAPLAARVTLLPEQWSRCQEVFDHLTGLGFHEVSISPASPTRREFIPGPDHEEQLLQGFSSLARRFVHQARQGRVLPFTNLIDLLARLHVGQTKTVSCGAGLGYLAVDAVGDFYICHRLAGDDSFCVGSLESGPDAKKIMSALEKLTAGKEAECRSCWGRTLCHGGCHYENHLRENLLGLAPGSSCSFILRWLRLGIETYAELQGNGCENVLQMLEKRVKC